MKKSVYDEHEQALLLSFGKRLTYLRKEKKWSQLDLSIESGFAISFLSDLEKGRRNPSLLTLHRLASTFGITVEVLLAGVDDLMPL